MKQRTNLHLPNVLIKVLNGMRIFSAKYDSALSKDSKM